MPMSLEPTTVADDLVVVHDGTSTRRYEGLAPGATHELDGVLARTLPRPAGELLSRFATVNDVHFGETVCGVVDDHRDGPILRREPGQTPYPELMNRAAVVEIDAIDPAAVIVKGDLSAEGTDSEWTAFEECYGCFDGRLHVVRGNHDAYHGQDRYAGDRWIDLPGVLVGLLDTTIPTRTTGGLREQQLHEIDERAGSTDGRVLLLGHHQQWIGRSVGPGNRSDDYFGMHPDASDALDEVCERHPNVIAYAAGHTHRHRVRSMRRSGIPSIEIGCVKDFPGTWAEYRVYEGGVMQVVHRISDPEALEWSDRCRVLYSDFGIDYEAYAAGTLAQRCFVITERAPDR